MARVRDPSIVDEDDKSIAWCNIKNRDESKKPIKRGGTNARKKDPSIVDEDDKSIAWCNIKPDCDECMKTIKHGGHQCQELFYKYY